MIDLLARRREMMGASGGEEYITDGLVFHLDGINRGTTDPTKWIDLVGGVEFSGNDSWGATYRIGGHSNYMIAYGVREVSLDSGTMEVVYRMDSNNNERLYEPNVRGGNNFCFGHAGQYISLTNNPANKMCVKQSNAPLNADHCFSYNAVSIVIDGGDVPSVNYDWFYGMSDGSTRIGHLGCRIYSIRFYNRLLTTDEMLHNQRIDNERFNLGLTI